MNREEAFAVFDNMAQQHFDELFKPVSNVYLDLDMLWDHRIGALVSMVKTSAEYEYILHKLDAYNDNWDKRISTNFPILDISDEMVDNFIQDPDNSKLISFTSPIKTCYANLPLWLDSIFSHNRKQGKVNDVTLYINSQTFCPHKEFQESVVKALQNMFPNLNVGFIATSLDKFHQKIPLTNIQFFIISDFQRFMMPDTVFPNLLMNDMVFSDTYLKVAKTVDLDILQQEDRPEIDELFNRTKLTMDLFCKFEYIDNLTLRANPETESPTTEG